MKYLVSAEMREWNSAVEDADHITGGLADRLSPDRLVDYLLNVRPNHLAAQRLINAGAKLGYFEKTNVRTGAIDRLRIEVGMRVDAQWLCTLAGKATVLASDARRFNIDLDLQWIPGPENPADKFTVANGFKKWSDNDLAAFASAIPVTPP